MQMTLRQKELATGMTVLLVVFGGFLCAEMAFRTIQEARYGTDIGLETPVVLVEETVDGGRKAPVGKIKAGFYFDDEIELRVPVPGQKMGRVSINSHGFRGPDIPLEKPPGTARVAFLGSSTTYDASAPEGGNWPELTIERLREKGGGRAIDFINAGMPGFLSGHMEAYWERKVSRYQVDLAIILPGDMTADLQTAAVRSGFERTGIQGEDWLSRHSLLWAGIVKNAAMVRAQRTAFNVDMPFKPDRNQILSAFKLKLGSLVGTVLQGCRRVALVKIASRVRRGMTREQQLEAAGSALYYMPYLGLPALIDFQDAYNIVIEEVAHEYGVLLIEDEDSIPPDSVHFDDSRHFAPAGSRVQAARVADAIWGNADMRAVFEK